MHLASRPEICMGVSGKSTSKLTPREDKEGERAIVRRVEAVVIFLCITLARPCDWGHPLPGHEVPLLLCRLVYARTSRVC